MFKGVVLLYKPPCGDWYVHSHKIYDTAEEAYRAAERFLPAGTEIAYVPLSTSQHTLDIILNDLA